MNKKFRLGIVVSHPIQHFCPQYISFSKLENVEVKLFFASMLGYKKYTDKNFGQEIVWNNLRIEEFNHVFLNGEQVIPSNKHIDAPTLEVELDAFKPDAIISYGYFQKLQRRAHKWAKKTKTPIAYITDAENRQQRPMLKKLAKYFYLQWYLKKIDYFFTVGNANEEYYRTYGVPVKKFIRMHYPIDIDVYKKAYEEKAALRSKIREQYNILQEDLVMSVVGKLVEWKNQDHMINLLLELEKRGKRAHVFILGSGTMLEQWKEKAKILTTNKAHFPGFVDPLQLPEFYAASDLYVHPARIEPHSLAISEAIYMGNPVIVTDKSGSYGPTDDVQIDKNGYVYNFGDLNTLADKVIGLIDNRALLNTFSKYSHATSLKFQERSHKQCVLDLIKNVTATK